MKTIYRYPIKWTANQTIELPENAQPLYAKVCDDGEPSIYAVVDTATEETKKVRIIMLGTGCEISDVDFEHMKPLGAVKKKRGGIKKFLTTQYVFHVFMVID